MNKQMINNEEMRISSREVAEMLKVTRHGDMLEKIEGINQFLENNGIRFQTYWVESCYKVENNKRTYKEYLVSKKGCELLAHKMTGEKGVLFTIKYMDKFESMEKELKNKKIDSYMIDDPVARAKAWIGEYEEKQILTKNIQAQKEIIQEYKPKVESFDEWISNNNLSTTTTVAKMLGFRSAMQLNRELELRGIQYKQGDCWHLRAEYAGLNYTTYRGHTIKHSNGLVKSHDSMYWTNAGKVFLKNILNKNIMQMESEYRQIGLY